QDLAERDHRELEREAAGAPHPALDRLRHLAQVRVAVVQLRPRVADADHRAAVEYRLAEALGLEIGSVHEAVEILGGEPVAAAERRGRGAESAHEAHILPCLLDFRQWERRGSAGSSAWPRWPSPAPR